MAELIFEQMGQAAAAAAALSLENKTTPHALGYPVLAERLKEGRAMLDPNEPKAGPTKPQTVSAADQSKADLQLLAERKIIANADDWIGKDSFDGAAVSALIIQAASQFQPVTQPDEALGILQREGILKSSAYWSKKAVEGQKCGASNTLTLLHNLAAKLRQR